MTIQTKYTKDFPMLPLRDVVVYPQLVIPLFVGREKSISAIEKASNGNKKILLVAQKTAGQDEPEIKDLYTVGTVASILQMLKLPDGTVKVLVEGLERANIKNFNDSGDFWSADISLIKIREKKR
jgi:ATP-dependent Lon protease